MPKSILQYIALCIGICLAVLLIWSIPVGSGYYKSAKSAGSLNYVVDPKLEGPIHLVWDEEAESPETVIVSVHESLTIVNKPYPSGWRAQSIRFNGETESRRLHSQFAETHERVYDSGSLVRYDGKMIQTLYIGTRDSALLYFDGDYWKELEEVKRRVK